MKSYKGMHKSGECFFSFFFFQMYRLSKLPIEILYIIASHLSIQDLINVARLNIWYGYRLSSVLSERIKELVEKDGWRIHVRSL